MCFLYIKLLIIIGLIVYNKLIVYNIRLHFISSTYLSYKVAVSALNAMFSNTFESRVK